MSTEFEKHTIEDFGQKLAHLEGILGAYLPKHVFDSEVQQQTIDCNKFTFSRLRSGKRKAVNWELGRFIELFDLAKFQFDYRLFLLPFDEFGQELKRAGAGSHGTTVAEQLREALRKAVNPKAEITIHRDRVLNVGGIGDIEDDPRVLQLTQRDKVTLKVPLQAATANTDHLLLLHDFPSGRATSCLMPSIFAPNPGLSGQSIRLPQSASGHFSFPVGGAGGYRCLYGIQSSTDLAAYIGLKDAPNTVPEVQAGQVAMLVDFLGNASAQEREQIYVSFGEYLLK